MACQNYFETISDKDFADEVRRYPCLWDSSKKQFKNSRTTKVIAWQEIATTFKTDSESAQLRYKTLRTRISRYLKVVKPSGSGTNDFAVEPEYKNFRWMFLLIKARKTSTNFIKKAQTEESMITAVHSDEDVSGEDEEKNKQPLNTITNNQVGSPTY